MVDSGVVVSILTIAVLILVLRDCIITFGYVCEWVCKEEAKLT